MVNLLLRAACAVTLVFSVPAFAQLTVDNAWVKGANAGQMATAAYMTLRATQPIRITGAESPVAGVVEIHQMTLGANDTMTMRAVPTLDLAKGDTVELKPGGLHIMLMDLSKTPLKPGDTVALTLLLQTADGKNARQTVKASVKPLGHRDGRGGAASTGHDPGHQHHSR